ncbi:hypothetical protein HD554DRAFT_654013 [Boletus coccyginus]|nr:hypothetical protein HD554DRAFT_654013 [Boletus coccyginus]
MGLYDTTIGALLVGVFFNTFLYGLVTYQFAAYYQTEFNDRPTVKYMVFFLFILDTFHSGSAIYMVWYYTVTNYDNPASLLVGVWPYVFTAIGTALAALVTHIYLGFRIWCLTDSIILYGVVILLAIPSFILGMACGIEGYLFEYVPSAASRITPLAIACFSTQIAADVFITITLTIIFSRSRNGIHKTDAVLNRLIRGAIQTGFFVGIFSLGTLITFVLLEKTNLFAMFSIPIGRIYTNTLMDSLLAREFFKAKMFDTQEVSGLCCPVVVTRSSLVANPIQSYSIGWTPPNFPQSTLVVGPTSDQLTLQRTIQETRDRLSCEGAQSKSLPLVAV